MMLYGVMLAILFGLAAGQMLFKQSAKTLVLPFGFETLWQLALNPVFLAALVLYGCSTIAYVWVLNQLPLSRAYAFFALSFVLVPALGMMLFGETLTTRFALGSVLIIAGVLLAVRG